MHIQVRLLHGFNKPLTYRIPTTWQNVQPGTIVNVPVRKSTYAAIVEQIVPQPTANAYQIREAISIETMPIDTSYMPFIKSLAAYYQVDYVSFIKRIRDFLHQKESTQSIYSSEIRITNNVSLTQEQSDVATFIKQAIDKHTYQPTLLHGVTGAGKTEVYKSVIEHAFANRKSTILLLPEVSLAVEFTKKLKHHFNNFVFGFHSASSKSEKKLLWQHLINQHPVLIIGVHLPIMLPISNVGLIIIDEEHDVGYQEKKHPRINSKEAALLRAKQYQIPILLGSATPSISSLHNVAHKNWSFFQLKQRFSGAFPTIQLVSLAQQYKRNHFWISKQLQQAIAKQLSKKEQTIIFLNRRGYSFFVQCRHCSFIFSCAACSVSLTLHEDNKLTCHYCNFSIQCPLTCTTCSGNTLLKKGIGTQQVVALLQKMFPQANIARADLDTTVNKKKWQETLDAFRQGTIDILVGTQTITKGYHFPGVTLVGVLWADANLHFPLYNAAETTLQQLIQVAGRAGRNSKESTVIIQSIDNHPIFAYLDEVNYLAFYQTELEKRNLVSYPPFIRLVDIQLKSDDQEIIEYEANTIVAHLTNYIQQHALPITLLGPAKPLVHKIKHWHTRAIYLKGNSIQQLIAVYKQINHAQYKSSIYFTPNPLG